MVAAMLGKPFMQWQQDAADVILEIDEETGDLAYDEWVVLTPRQSGKSTFILAKSTHRGSATGFFGSRQHIVYTAQTRQKAREKWDEDFTTELAHSRAFRSKTSVYKGGGNEHTRFANGSRFGIEANTEKAGHGGTLDEAYIDEAFAQVDNRLEQAFGPAMITRRNKQLGIISTAGWTDTSPYLLAKVVMGRQLVADDVRRGTCYIEYSAPDDADPADESVWFDCMPALHRPTCKPGCRSHTIRVKAIRAEWDKAKRSGKISDFCRAYLNQWKPRPAESEETALGDWGSCAERGLSEPEPSAIGVAVSLDRTIASIGAAGDLGDGRVYVAPVDRRAGTDWLVERVLQIQQDRGCLVVVDEKGPAGDLIGVLEDAGVKVTVAKLNDYVEACAALADRVSAGKLAHPGDAELDDSVLGARWRMVGDRRVFGRKASVTDVSLLETVTLASWGADRPPSVYEDRGLLRL